MSIPIVLVTGIASVANVFVTKVGKDLIVPNLIRSNARPIARDTELTTPIRSNAFARQDLVDLIVRKVFL